MARKPTRADLLELMQLVNDCASQEWQDPDGKKKAAVDNSGHRLWFISEPVMQEIKTALAEAKAKQ